MVFLAGWPLEGLWQMSTEIGRSYPPWQYSAPAWRLRCFWSLRDGQVHLCEVSAYAVWFSWYNVHCTRTFLSTRHPCLILLHEQFWKLRSCLSPHEGLVSMGVQVRANHISRTASAFQGRLWPMRREAPQGNHCGSPRRGCEEYSHS